jgi:hypothetical protein
MFYRRGPETTKMFTRVRLFHFLLTFIVSGRDDIARRRVTKVGAIRRDAMANMVDTFCLSWLE